MKGLIVIGFPGIGKTTCGGKNHCIDLESSLFHKILGVEDEWNGWVSVYTNVAIDLAKQGYTVFVSSHSDVQKALKETEIPVSVFCPTSSMKDEWCERLKDRFMKTGYYKDLAAYRSISDHFDSYLKGLINSGFPIYQPTDMNYNFSTYISKMRNDLCNEV